MTNELDSNFLKELEKSSKDGPLVLGDTLFYGMKNLNHLLIHIKWLVDEGHILDEHDMALVLKEIYITEYGDALNSNEEWGKLFTQSLGFFEN